MAPETPRTRRWRAQAPLIAVGVTYLVLGLGYSLATPVGEGPDEGSHIAYVDYLRQHHRLPLLEDVSGPVAEQVKHPPLYYLLLAVATAPGTLDGLSYVANPHCCNLERPSPATMRHPDGDRFPYAPGYRTARFGRLVTLLLGLVAVGATYAAARVAFPRRPELAMAAAACIAFLPQFLFMQGVINNDGLANMWGALALWAALRVALEGATRRDLLLLGLFVGFGLVTKLTMMAWVAVGSLAVGSAAYRARSGRVVGRAAVWCGLPLLLASGWWFAWNLAAKGDILGWGRWVGSASIVHRKVPLATQLADYAAIQWQSFWGSFGWVTVRMPDPVYRLLSGVALLALIGLAVAAGRWWQARRAGVANERPLLAVAILVAAVLLVYASVFQLSFTFDLTVAQGRYLFTALGAVAILFALGLLSLAPPRLARLAGAAVVGGMLLLALYGLFGVLWPTFRPPDRLTPAEVAAIAHPVDADFGSGIHLLGYELPATGVHPGAALPVRLDWVTRQWVDAGYVLFAHVVDAAGQVVGRTDALPRHGLYPTVLWYPDWPWRDTVTVPIAPWAAPGAARVLVGLYPNDHPEARVTVRQGGADIGDHVTLGPVLIRADTPVTLPVSVTARTDVLGLPDAAGQWQPHAYLAAFAVAPAGAATAGGTPVDVTLYWEAAAPFPTDYTVFVHALDRAGAQRAGGDGPPGGGRYPTSLWQPGDVVADRHRLLLPPGVAPDDVTWSVGLYEPATGVRMPARSADGAVWPDAAIELGR